MYDYESVVSQYIFIFSRYYPDVDPSILPVYARKVKLHIEAVQEAGRWLEVPEDLLEKHDQSKWSKAEFFDYAVKFHSDHDNAAQWRAAWLHHIHNNPHHWQHWLIPGNPLPVKMPEPYADEMVADWLGAGKVYSRSWDNINEWLMDNIYKITLHPETADHVMDTLLTMGYGREAFKEYEFKTRLWP